MKTVLMRLNQPTGANPRLRFERWLIQTSFKVAFPLQNMVIVYIHFINEKNPQKHMREILVEIRDLC